MLTIEQINQTLEQAVARYEQLNTELAGVDDKIREREALRNQIDWLQGFPGFQGVDFGKVQEHRLESGQSHGQVVDRAVAQVAEETAVPQAVIQPEATEDSSFTATDEGTEDGIEIPAARDSLAKMKLPELKALARQENIELTGRNKADIVDAIAEALYDDEPEPDEPPAYNGAAVPEGFTGAQEAAPAPQAAPQPAVQGAAPAPQVGASPFTF